MKPLSVKLSKNRFEYRFRQKGRRSYIYAQRGTNCDEAYEVFIIRYREERIIEGKILPAKERFPSNEDFGKFAWAYRTWAEAWNKFCQLEGLDCLYEK